MALSSIDLDMNSSSSLFSGCQNSPAYKSRFCEGHKDLMCSFQDDSSEMHGNSVTVKIALEDKAKDVFPVRVLSERVTHQGNFYEVITMQFMSKYLCL